jgi:hypothetical protein
MLTKLGINTQPRLSEQNGNEITTDKESGLLIGTVQYLDTDAPTAYTRRPIPGSAYNGTLREYAGMLADQSRVVRIIGDRAIMEVTYLGIDQNFKILPRESSDLEYRDLTIDLGLVSFTFEPVPVPHPVLSYKFVDTNRQNQRGQFNLNPPNAPTISDYIARIHGYDRLSGGVGNEVFDMVFKPTKAGWLCLQDDPVPLCGGKLFAIQQQWKRTYFFDHYTRPGGS